MIQACCTSHSRSIVETGRMLPVEKTLVLGNSYQRMKPAAPLSPNDNNEGLAKPSGLIVALLVMKPSLTDSATSQSGAQVCCLSERSTGASAAVAKDVPTTVTMIMTLERCILRSSLGLCDCVRRRCLACTHSVLSGLQLNPDLMRKIKPYNNYTGGAVIWTGI